MLIEVAMRYRRGPLYHTMVLRSHEVVCTDYEMFLCCSTRTIINNLSSVLCWLTTINYGIFNPTISVFKQQNNRLCLAMWSIA